MPLPLIFLAAILLVSCSTATTPATRTPAAALSAADKQKIGNRIWQNECAGTIDGLTTWNAGENFPSLGIGHALWFPANAREPFSETFPSMVLFIRDRGTRVPAWLLPPADCPWPDRATFLHDFQSPRMRELRQWLASTIPQQTDYLIARQQAALPKILAACPPSDRPRVQHNFAALSASPSGLFCLIDYVNFKGEGTNPSERYNGQGWGLLQVLQDMQGTPSPKSAPAVFAAAATRTLNRRIQNSPPARGEARWQAGWANRCARYAKPL
jgi:hypothetical protein